MRRPVAIALSILIGAVIASPAMGEPTGTELIDVEGKSVDGLQLRHDFDAGWVIDNQNLLYRDTSRAHYLVTLQEACRQLDVRGRRFHFFPSWSWRVTASQSYEIRPEAGPRCDVARIEMVDGTRASTLRAEADRRIW